MQGIYNYVLETNHVSTVYSVAALLHLRSALLVILFLMLHIKHLNISSVCSTCAVPIWLFALVPSFRSCCLHIF